MTIILRAVATDGVVMASDGRTVHGWPHTSISEYTEKIRDFKLCSSGFMVATSGRATIDQKPVNAHISEIVSEMGVMKSLDTNRLFENIQQRMRSAPPTNEHDQVLQLVIQEYDLGGPTRCTRWAVNSDKTVALDCATTFSVQGELEGEQTNGIKHRVQQIMDERALLPLTNMRTTRNIVKGILSFAYKDSSTIAKRQPFMYWPEFIEAELELKEYVTKKWGANWSNLSEKARQTNITDLSDYREFDRDLQSAIDAGTISAEESELIMASGGAAGVGGSALITQIGMDGHVDLANFEERQVLEWDPNFVIEEVPGVGGH
ncbi:hypothetical protein [Rhodococcoides fascians]|uniref:hypothetical protein n=1 Tax=Rhodococcoides fascians TaxID=1828 RepID=UPI001114F46C|nr:hypothetical protein [Rhodococcus fascians]